MHFSPYVGEMIRSVIPLAEMFHLSGLNNTGPVVRGLPNNIFHKTAPVDEHDAHDATSQGWDFRDWETCTSSTHPGRERIDMVYVVTYNALRTLAVFQGHVDNLAFASQGRLDFTNERAVHSLPRRKHDQ